jgi:O-antigen ligase
MRRASAIFLYAVLTASILTAWIPQRWSVSILEVGAFLLALAWVVKLAISAQRPRLAVILAPVAFFTAWGLLQLACHWTVAASEAVRATLGWAANLALLFAALQTFDHAVLRRGFLDGLLWFAFLVSIAGILQRLASHTDASFAMGPFLYHNHFAAFIEIVLPFALLQPRRRLWYSFLAAVMIAAVIVSASRSGTALVLLETAVIFAITRKRPVTILIATAALITIVGWDSLVTRLQEQHPYHDRLQMLRSSVDMFSDHPLTGVGLGNWPIVFPYYARYDDGLFANQAHSDWAQAADEAGLPGLAAFALFFALIVRQRNIGLVFVFLHALVDYPFHNPQIAALVCVLCAFGRDTLPVGDAANRTEPMA